MNAKTKSFFCLNPPSIFEINAFNIYLCFLCLAVLGSCTTVKQSQTLKFTIEVDSYGNDNTLSGRSYYMLPGDSDIKESDLQFIEFAGYVKKVLNATGYKEVLNKEEADLMVFLRYGISDPKTFVSNYQVPNWGVTGTKSSQTTGNITLNPYSNSAKYTENKTSQPTYGVTGYRNVSKETTYFIRFADVGVYDYKIFLKTNNDKVVWKTLMTSKGTNGDLRKVFPFLIIAGKDYFGKSSGEKKMMLIYENDARINQLK